MANVTRFDELEVNKISIRHDPIARRWGDVQNMRTYNTGAAKTILDNVFSKCWTKDQAPEKWEMLASSGTQIRMGIESDTIAIIADADVRIYFTLVDDILTIDDGSGTPHRLEVVGVNRRIYVEGYNLLVRLFMPRTMILRFDGDEAIIDTIESGLPTSLIVNATTMNTGPVAISTVTAPVGEDLTLFNANGRGVTIDYLNNTTVDDNLIANNFITTTARVDTNLIVDNVNGTGLPLTELYLDDGVADVGTVIPTLVNGKLKVEQLPYVALEYKGGWNANTNVAGGIYTLLANGQYQEIGVGVPINGASKFFVVSVAGTFDLDGTTDWLVGDWAVSNGTVWEKVDNTDRFTIDLANKLATIEESADVTDTANVAAAGAIMNTGGTITGTLSATNILTGSITATNSSVTTGTIQNLTVPVAAGIETANIVTANITTANAGLVAATTVTSVAVECASVALNATAMPISMSQNAITVSPLVGYDDIEVASVGNNGVRFTSSGVINSRLYSTDTTLSISTGSSADPVLLPVALEIKSTNDAFNGDIRVLKRLTVLGDTAVDVLTANTTTFGSAAATTATIGTVGATTANITIGNIATINADNITATAETKSATVVATTSVTAPLVSATTSVTTPLVSATTSVTAPAIIGTATVAAPIGNITTVNSTNVAATAAVTAPALVGTATVAAPVGNITTVNSAIIVATTSVTAPALVGTATVAAPVGNITTINATDVIASNEVKAATLTATTAISAPTITAPTLVSTTAISAPIGNITTVNATTVNANTIACTNIIAEPSVTMSTTNLLADTSMRIARSAIANSARMSFLDQTDAYVADVSIAPTSGDLITSVGSEATAGALQEATRTYNAGTYQGYVSTVKGIELPDSAYFVTKTALNVEANAITQRDSSLAFLYNVNGTVTALAALPKAMSIASATGAVNIHEQLRFPGSATESIYEVVGNELHLYLAGEAIPVMAINTDPASIVYNRGWFKTGILSPGIDITASATGAVAYGALDILGTTLRIMSGFNATIPAITCNATGTVTVPNALVAQTDITNYTLEPIIRLRRTDNNKESNIIFQNSDTTITGAITADNTNIIIRAGSRLVPTDLIDAIVITGGDDVNTGNVDFPVKITGELAVISSVNSNNLATTTATITGLTAAAAITATSLTATGLVQANSSQFVTSNLGAAVANDINILAAAPVASIQRTNDANPSVVEFRNAAGLSIGGVVMADNNSLQFKAGNPTASIIDMPTIMGISDTGLISVLDAEVKAFTATDLLISDLEPKMVIQRKNNNKPIHIAFDNKVGTVDLNAGSISIDPDNIMTFNTSPVVGTPGIRTEMAVSEAGVVATNQFTTPLATITTAGITTANITTANTTTANITTANVTTTNTDTLKISTNNPMLDIRRIDTAETMTIAMRNIGGYYISAITTDTSALRIHTGSSGTLAGLNTSLTAAANGTVTIPTLASTTATVDTVVATKLSVIDAEPQLVIKRTDNGKSGALMLQGAGTSYIGALSIDPSNNLCLHAGSSTTLVGLPKVLTATSAGVTIPTLNTTTTNTTTATIATASLTNTTTATLSVTAAAPQLTIKRTTNTNTSTIAMQNSNGTSYTGALTIDNTNTMRLKVGAPTTVALLPTVLTATAAGVTIPALTTTSINTTAATMTGSSTAAILSVTDMTAVTSLRLPNTLTPSGTAVGQIVYNTTTNQTNVYNGSTWGILSTTSAKAYADAFSASATSYGVNTNVNIGANQFSYPAINNSADFSLVGGKLQYNGTSTKLFNVRMSLSLSWDVTATYTLGWNYSISVIAGAITRTKTFIRPTASYWIHDANFDFIVSLANLNTVQTNFNSILAGPLSINIKSLSVTVTEI